MFKKATVFLLIAVFLLAASAAFGSVKYQHKLTKLSDTKYIYQDNMYQHRLTVITNADGKGAVIDTLSWYDPDPANFNGGLAYTFPGDTVIENFKLIADPAYLMKIRGIFEDGGLANFFVWQDGGEYPGPTILDNRNWNVTGNAPGGTNWDELDFGPTPTDTVYLPWSPDPNYADRPFFVIGYVSSGTGGQGGGVPDICYDFNGTYIPGGPRAHCWFSYNGATWYGVRYTASQAWAQWYFEVVVNYYDGTHIFINDMNQLNDTWATQSFAPVKAELIDVDGTIVNAWLYYQKNNDPADSVAYSSITGDIYEFNVPGTYVAGDSVSYWIAATDNDGKRSINSPLGFKVLAPTNPAAQVLVVFDALQPGESDLTVFWQPVLDAVIIDSLGMQYEMWGVQEHKGIDVSIVDYPTFETALVFGFGVSCVTPFDYSTSVWKNFVEAGKNFMIASPDFLYANGLGGEYNSITGDFLKDILGVGWVNSDPVDGSGNSLGDQFIMGISGDPVSDPWGAAPIVLNFDVLLGGANWGDYAEADAGNPNAANSFMGVISSRGNGVRNINSFGGATLYLPFSYAAIVDSNAAGEPVIINDSYKLLYRFFDGCVGIEESGLTMAHSYELCPNYPNPFNPNTTIQYSIKETGNVRLEIYNLLGEKVRTLVNNSQVANNYSVTWDGTNNLGVKVASGIYIYKLSAGDFNASHKMILMK